MKTAIIVGATSGIGRSLGILLSKNGYKVAVTGKQQNLLEEVKSNNADNIICSVFDVANPMQSKEKLDELASQLGKIDLIVLCAGIGGENPNLDFDLEKQTIDVNVIGFTVITDWAINFFKKQQFGHFAAITSVAGLWGNPEAVSYSATKAYEINYLKGLRKKINKLKMPIYITDLRPGFVDTAMAKSKNKFWVAPLDRACKQIFSAIKNKKRVAYITNRWVIFGVILKLIG